MDILMKNTLLIITISLILIILTSCNTNSTDKIGNLDINNYSEINNLIINNRDLLYDGREQFKVTLVKYNDVFSYNVKEKEALEISFNELKVELDICKSKVDEIKKSIENLENKSTNEFNSWRTELNQYSIESLKSKSIDLLTITEKKYTDIISDLKKSETEMDSTYIVFHDNVLLLKHMLRASTINEIDTEKNRIEGEINVLIDRMNKSIEKADEFINGNNPII